MLIISLAKKFILPPPHPPLSLSHPFPSACTCFAISLALALIILFSCLGGVQVLETCTQRQRIQESIIDQESNDPFSNPCAN